MTAKINFSVGQSVTTAQSASKEGNASHRPSETVLTLLAQAALGSDVKERNSVAASSNPVVAEALKTLALLFNENFIGSKHPIKLEQLYGFSLGQLIEISYISLLVSMLEKVPYNEDLYQPTLAIISSLSNKQWKTKDVATGSFFIKKQYFELIKKLNLHSNHSAWMSSLVKHLGTIEILAKQTDLHNLPVLNPVLNKEIQPEVLNFVREVVCRYGEMAFFVHQHIQKDLEVFLKQVIGCNGHVKEIKDDVKAGFKQGQIKQNVQNVMTAKATNMSQQFENISDWLYRLCFCTGTLMKGFQSQFRNLTFTATNQSHISEISFIQNRFYKGFEKRVDKLSPILINFENSEAIFRHAYLSDTSKIFLARFYLTLDCSLQMLAEGILAAIVKGPNFLQNLNKGSQTGQVECLKKTYASLGFFVSHWLIEKAPSYAKSKIIKSEASLMQLKLKEKEFGISFAQAKAAQPILVQAINELCDAFYDKRGKEIAQKFSGVGDSAALLYDYISNNVQSEMLQTLAATLMGMAESYDLAQLNKSKQQWRTNDIALVFYNDLKMILDSAKNPKYDVEKLVPFRLEKYILYKLFFKAKNDLNNLYAVEFVRSTLVSLLVSSQATVTAASNSLTEQNWFEIIAEQDNEDLEVIDNEGSTTALEADLKAVNATPTKQKSKFRGTKKTIKASEVALSAPSYVSRSDRLLSLFRQKLYKTYDVRRDAVPATLLGTKTNAIKIATHQQLLALESLQVVREMQELTTDAEALQLLETCLALYEHLAMEQGMTVPDAEQFPDSKRTHRLALMNERLKLDASVDNIQNGVLGTARIRYPQCYAARQKESAAQSSEATSQNTDHRIKALVEVQLKALGKSSLASAASHLQMESIWKESEAKGAEIAKKDKAAFSKQHCEKLTKACGELDATISELNLKIQALPATVDRKIVQALTNVRSHLMTLRRLTAIVPTYAYQRFLFVLAHMGIISTQYLVENLGLYLSFKDGLDPRKHNLLFYHVSQNLGEAMKKSEWETFKGVNVFKGSEYLYQYFSTRTRSQISPEMNHLSALYGASLQISSSATAASLTLEEMHKEFITHLINQIQLSNSIIKYHL